MRSEGAGPAPPRPHAEYAFMQAMGMVTEHPEGQVTRGEVEAA